MHPAYTSVTWVTFPRPPPHAYHLPPADHENKTKTMREVFFRVPFPLSWQGGAARLSGHPPLILLQALCLPGPAGIACVPLLCGSSWGEKNQKKLKMDLATASPRG